MDCVSPTQLIALSLNCDWNLQIPPLLSYRGAIMRSMVSVHQNVLLSATEPPFNTTTRTKAKGTKLAGHLNQGDFYLISLVSHRWLLLLLLLFQDRKRAGLQRPEGQR